MDVSFVRLFNFIIPSLSTVLSLFFIIIFTRKKKRMSLPSNFFLLFLYGTLLYSVLSGLRSSTTQMEIVIVFSKIIYVLNAFTVSSLFLTAYTLNKGISKINLRKFGLIISGSFLIGFLMFFDVVSATFNGIGWTVSMDAIVKIIYVTNMMIFTFGSLYYFRKVYAKTKNKRFKRKLKYFYFSIILILITFLLVFAFAFLAPNIPLTLQLIPSIAGIGLMLLPFVNN